jgi:hypothetical protein
MPKRRSRHRMPKRRSRHQGSGLDQSQVSLSSQKKIRIATRWWTIGVPLAAIVGAILGSQFLTGIVLIPFRMLLGAFLGSIGFTLLLLFCKEAITAPGAALEALLKTAQEGCCLYFFLSLVASIGVVGGLLIWYTVFL